jgi:hypothetical protein
MTMYRGLGCLGCILLLFEILVSGDMAQLLLIPHVDRLYWQFCAYFLGRNSWSGLSSMCGGNSILSIATSSSVECMEIVPNPLGVEM